MRNKATKKLALTFFALFLGMCALALLLLPNYLANTNQDIRQQAATNNQQVAAVFVQGPDVIQLNKENTLTFYYNPDLNGKINTIGGIQLDFWVEGGGLDLEKITPVLRAQNMTMQVYKERALPEERVQVSFFATPKDGFDKPIVASGNVPFLELKISPTELGINKKISINIFSSTKVIPYTPNTGPLVTSSTNVFDYKMGLFEFPISTSQTTQPESISLDINQDGKENILDYNILITDILGDNSYIQGTLRSDLNKDGFVNINDYSIFVSNFSQ